MHAVLSILALRGSDEGLLIFTGGMILLWIIFVAAMVALSIVIWWKIFAKAGYSGALGLLMFVPIANLVMMLVLAFGEWPIHREMAQLRAASGIGPSERWREFR